MTSPEDTVRDDADQVIAPETVWPSRGACVATVIGCRLLEAEVCETGWLATSAPDIPIFLLAACALGANARASVRLKTAIRCLRSKTDNVPRHRLPTRELQCNPIRLDFCPFT